MLCRQHVLHGCAAVLACLAFGHQSWKHLVQSVGTQRFLCTMRLVFSTSINGSLLINIWLCTQLCLPTDSTCGAACMACLHVTGFLTGDL